MAVSISHLYYRSAPILNYVLLGIASILMLGCVGLLQRELDLRQDRIAVQIQSLAQLPKGEYLKPALLGYQHLGADGLWLKLVQVLGNKRNSADEYEWMYHALDVITTLDPQYAYAYYAGGVVLGDLAGRTDLSNRLLERGVHENPDTWNIPFLLGYNHYFLLGDPMRGAEYIMKAASLPGHPAYLPGLATRLAAEAGSPETALVFLGVRLQETQDAEMRIFYMNRMKEVIIERDIQQLERALGMYQAAHGNLPGTLAALVSDHILRGLPQEPFGGEYQMDVERGRVFSSTHPNRLRTFAKFNQAPPSLLPKLQPPYVFPRTWE